MKYLELKQKHEKEFNDFPIFFAFSEKQFNDGMVKLGLNPENTDQVYRTAYSGFIKKSDAENFRNMIDRHYDEKMSALEDDDYLFDAIYYELGNHEYCITGDIYETLSAVGVLGSDERVKKITSSAIEKYMSNVIY